MVWRLGDWIRAGEIDNTVSNTVLGWLHLWGQHHPVLLHLTGNAGRGLRGRKLRFRAANAPPASLKSKSASRTNTNTRSQTRAALQAQQIGPVGRMRLAACEIPELGTWRMRLLLEWFSQDGRVVLDVWEPLVEFILRPGVHQRTATRDGFNNLLAVDAGDWGCGELPSRLLSSPDAHSDDASNENAGLHSAGDAGYWRMLDDVFTGARDVPLNTLFDPPLRLLPADQLDERGVLRALRDVLARLARYGIAIDMCPHYTARQTYEWLLAEILPGEEVFPELPRLGYVMHYMTSEQCPQCAEVPF